MVTEVVHAGLMVPRMLRKALISVEAVFHVQVQ